MGLDDVGIDDLLPPQITTPFKILPSKRAKTIGGAVDDALVKDQRILASQLIREETGWRGNDAKLAVAVMMPESGGNPNIVNERTPCSQDGDHAVGLMQICTIHKGQFGIPAQYDAAVQWLKNPRNNVKAGYKLWLVQGWDAWETITSGRASVSTFKDFLVTVGDKSLTGDIADAVTAPLDAALGPIDEIASAVLSPSTWFRVGKGTAGAALIILGVAGMVFVVASKSNAAKSALAVANPATKATGAVKAATAAVS